MRSLSLPAYAKINLTLDVLGKRPDGYHELCMVMQSVSLADTVTITETANSPLGVSSNLDFLPGVEKNIATVAARVFAAHTGASVDNLLIALEKRIPVCAGTAGGSSDGAAVLRGLNRWFAAGLSPEQLAEMGREIGSDVPYCVLGGTMLAKGRGELLTPLPSLPECCIVLCKPGFSVSTPELYHKIDEVRLRFRPDTAGVCRALEQGDLAGVSRRMFNVFEQVLPAYRRAEIEDIKSQLLESGALGACMSGTGPTVFGIFHHPEEAELAVARLKENWPSTHLTKPVCAL